MLFVKPTSSLIGTEGTIIIPSAAQPVKDHLPDYEVEFTIVIGKAAKDVKEEDALDYVLAYTGANDVSLIRGFRSGNFIVLAGLFPQTSNDRVSMVFLQGIRYVCTYLVDPDEPSNPVL